MSDDTTTKELPAQPRLEPKLCTRCNGSYLVDQACWWCKGPLCFRCWDLWGDCGHPEAMAAEERMVKHHGHRGTQVLDMLKGRRPAPPVLSDVADVDSPPDKMNPLQRFLALVRRKL